MLVKEIQNLAKEFREETTKNRKHLHRYPELSFNEKKTAQFIREKLDRMDIPYEIKAKNGTVGILQGTKSSSNQATALRADIDALPITEENEVEYKSQNDGVMHACGHDAHTASLLTVARILKDLKPKFSGTVKFLFQPAEEKIPGGAKQMIKEKALENPRPKSVIGQHTMPELESGKVGFHPGNYMASSDEFFITIKGKGGHAAMPHLSVDPVTIAAQVITSLQQVVSRRTNPLIPTVLTIGRLMANGSTNVIPNKVTLEGTLRTLDEEWRHEARELIRKIVYFIVNGMGGTSNIELKQGYPVLHNNESLNNNLRKHAEYYLGKENVVDLDFWMASEDFAYYAKEAPACFYRLGTGNKKKEIISELHTPTFDIDDKALEIGPGLMAYLALKTLENNP